MLGRNYSLRSMFHADAKILDGLSATGSNLMPAEDKLNFLDRRMG
jgi:hypothetical protein